MSTRRAAAGQGSHPARRRYRWGPTGQAGGQERSATVDTAARQEPGERAADEAIPKLAEVWRAGEWRPPLVRHHPLLGRLVFSSVWLAYLAAPVSSLVQRHSSDAELRLGIAAVVVFVIAYELALAADVWPARQLQVAVPALGIMTVLVVVTSLAFGKDWILLVIYISVAAVTCLPDRLMAPAVAACCALAVALGIALGLPVGDIAGVLLPTLAAGGAMLSFMGLIRTNIALRAARQEIARLAVGEERLRFARDLHDLLGHSLSLITLKSELAHRLLPDSPERAAAEVADVERVARQALAEVREAVSGYRRTTLEAELAGARVALEAAGIGWSAEVDPGPLPQQVEDALAWTVREGSTNVLRHSHARHCAVRIQRGDATVRVELLDDGRGAPPPGNGQRAGSGLAGLAERIAARGGSLAAGTRPEGGFRLRVELPLPAAE
jgi:two-component system sensor histidine kinase DesK